MNDLANAMGGTFRASEVEIQDFTPVPEGEYAVSVTDAQLKGTSKGGTMLVLSHTIITGMNEGRVIIDRLNVNCPGSPKAEDIAKQSLAKICKAIGVDTLDSTNQLIGKRMKIRIGIQKGQGTYIDSMGNEKPSQDQNNVKGYYSLNGETPAPIQQEASEPTPEAQSAQASNGAPPWAS